MVVAHPRYPWLPRFWRGTALERHLFARAAARALARGGRAPDVVLAHSALLPGGLIGRVGGAVFCLGTAELAGCSQLGRILSAPTLPQTARTQESGGEGLGRRIGGSPPAIAL